MVFNENGLGRDRERGKTKWLEVIEFNENGKRKAVAKCILESGVVRFEGGEKIIALLSQGISTPEGKKIMPEDGEEFLEAVQREFRSAYLFATEPREDESK